MFAYSQDQLQAVVNDPYATKAEREAAYKNLTDSYADEAWLQVNTIVNDYMKKVSDTGDIDPDFEKRVFDSSVQALMDRGLPQDMAVEMTQKAIDNSGLTMWETLNKTKTEDATKFANTYIEN